ncbi:MAG: beta-ketoacyl-[acyl-carrier-protein] synthase family protein [Kiritimatiellaeota bacterium]|nr:beta-ketoacyl-[acyl-carrier-protein] synthase family protein [Kiritimatiellota bacterium]
MKTTKHRENRVVITGVGLAAPNGDSLEEFRRNLLSDVSGVTKTELRFIGEVPAGLCSFDQFRYQNKREVRTGTRAGSIAVYCANEALTDAGVSLDSVDKSRIGIYIGITEHGNVETENEVHNISQFDYDVKYWNHYHNPRTVANNPAGEVTVNTGITGPHYCIGAACAAGNAGLIQGVQQLRLGEVDVALAGGVSESTGTFGIFASFKSQGALATHDDPAKASRPFDIDRTGIVVAEGGCLYVLERLDDALSRGSDIIAEVLGYAMNSDATHFVLPNSERQAECVAKAIERGGLLPGDMDIVNTHGTGTHSGDIQEAKALKTVFGSGSKPYFNNTKGFIGHAMGAAGALELAGNLPALKDGVVHPCMNLDSIDPECDLDNLIKDEPLETEDGVDVICNNSFGMLGINSVVIVGKYHH